MFQLPAVACVAATVARDFCARLSVGVFAVAFALNLPLPLVL
jgi:hypothetical protein